MTYDVEAAGFDKQRLARVPELIQRDVDAELFDGCVIKVSRNNQTVLHEAIGFSNRAAGRKTQLDDVFAIMSITKSLSAALFFTRVEQGLVSFTTPVAEIIPEFGVLGKHAVTVAQVLTHTAGLPTHPPVPPEQLGNLDLCVQALCQVPLMRAPGSGVSYSGWGSHYLIGEIVRRLDGKKRPLRKIIEEDLFQPLGMVDTSLGLRPDLDGRRVPLVMRSKKKGGYSDERLAALEKVLVQESSEVPNAGCFSTASDIHRFAQMLASGGKGEHSRILSPLLIRYAGANRTGDMPNDFWTSLRYENSWETYPGNIGLGFVVRGEGLHPTNFGLLNSPRAFGHTGAGSMLYWVNPELNLVFVMLTAGWMDERGNLQRFQKIGDTLLSSIVDL